MKMAGKIIIDTERCKGCGLCVTVCPKGCIIISRRSNKSGYFPAESVGSAEADCTGCAMCAIICPDAVIEVFCESKTVPAKSNKKGKPNLIKEKA
jgi:2-oxoglutarate ferredoxin oxidoreductase subunit delta